MSITFDPSLEHDNINILQSGRTASGRVHTCLLTYLSRLCRLSTRTAGFSCTAFGACTLISLFMCEIVDFAPALQPTSSITPVERL